MTGGADVAYVIRVAGVALGLLMAAAAVGLTGTAGAAHAVERPPTRADIAAEALRKDSVHISPHIDPSALGPKDIERIRAAARKVEAGGTPVYVSVSPVWDGDGSGEFGVAYLALLHDRLGKDGVYLHVAEDGDARLREYGALASGGRDSDIESKVQDWSDDESASLADIAVVALDGLRTGQVPRNRNQIAEERAHRGPEYRAEKAALWVGSAGAAAVAALMLLHRFTDVPLWPRRRRTPQPLPDVDWSSAPALPDHSYDTLYDLAKRRTDALRDAVVTAESAGLKMVASLADKAWDLADDLVISSLPPTLEPDPEIVAEKGLAFWEERLALVQGIDLPDLLAAIEVSRTGMLALAAQRDGVPLTVEPPCYHNPLHERGIARTPWTRDDGEVTEIAVCPACAEHGPDPLLVATEEGMVPYYGAEHTNAMWSVTGYGATSPDWPPEDLIEFLGRWAEEFDDDEPDVEPDDARDQGTAPTAAPGTDHQGEARS
ncbi:hypothetical protein ABZ208_26770 [Streptomyces sp. NPDC006208]|uniref:hypothetical protein n=1 Tax=Streptomyces sp. NPDC006208 TaxID=3156734 RepID=UPI0033AF8FA6